MFSRFSRLVGLLLGFALFVLPSVQSARYVLAQGSTPSWFSGAPTLSKTMELPANTQPPARNVDCTDETFTSAAGAPDKRCVFSSPLGELTTNGEIVTSNKQLVKLYGNGGSNSGFLPTVDPKIGLVRTGSTVYYAQYLGIYKDLSLADLKFNLIHSIGYTDTNYTVTKAPDTILKNSATGQPQPLNIGSIAFSSNGRWMVANTDHNGLIRVDMQTLQTKIFTARLEPDWLFGTVSPQMAISDDGRYVAANTSVYNSGALTLFDLSNCSDQTLVPTGQRHCASKNIWNGYVDNRQVDQGIISQLPSLVKPLSMRFINDDNISFKAMYDMVSGTNYRAAMFVVSTDGSLYHGLGLLGMGDSYISGEGEFAYEDGTDTGNNLCHLSDLSYPFLLGQKSFGTYNSVACSGAKTIDVTNGNSDYKGQASDGIALKNRTQESINSILAGFDAGYLEQISFAKNYQPEAILLSIGGNDSGGSTGGFASILKPCVLDPGTCDNTYQERKQMVENINSVFDKLTDTYTQLRQASPETRIYAIGYPQIAKVDGNCGANVHLNATEIQLAHDLIAYLDTIIQRAAAKAGVVYVDTQNALVGERLCEGHGSGIAVNGATVGDDVGFGFGFLKVKVIGNESFHPTVNGHKLLAAAISRQTSSLTQPMPMPDDTVAEPVVEASNPLLSNYEPTGGIASPDPVFDDDTFTNDVLLPGYPVKIDTDSSTLQLAPNTQYQIVLHSNPVVLGYATTDAYGSISTTVTLPADTPVGYHTVHLYGKDFFGNDVDIQKSVYVADPTNNSPCGPIAASGQDVDQDGIDDACDPVIGDAPTPPVATADNMNSSDTPATAANSVLGNNAPAATLATNTVQQDSLPSAGQPDVGSVLGSNSIENTPLKQPIARATSPSAKSTWQKWVLSIVAAAALVLVLRAALTRRKA